MTDERIDIDKNMWDQSKFLGDHNLVVKGFFSSFTYHRQIPIFCLDVKSNEWLGWQPDSFGC